MPADPVGRRRSARSRWRTFDHGRPIAQIDLAPFAAVVLIAGTLVASTYQLQTHALTVDLPVPLPAGSRGPLTPLYDVLALDEHLTLRWNGAVITAQELPLIIRQRQAKPDPGAMLFRPDADVSYRDTLAVIALLERHGAIDGCFRFSQLGRFGRFEDAVSPNLPAPPDYTLCDPTPAS